MSLAEKTVNVTVRGSRKPIELIIEERESKKQEKELCEWQMAVINGETVMGKMEWGKNKKLGKTVNINPMIRHIWVEDVHEGITEFGLANWDDNQ